LAGIHARRFRGFGVGRCLENRALCRVAVPGRPGHGARGLTPPGASGRRAFSPRLFPHHLALAQTRRRRGGAVPRHRRLARL
jgi:hypothetical protein